MHDLSFCLAQVTLTNITAIQLSIAVLGIITTIVLTSWRITRATRKDLDEKFSKKLDIVVFNEVRKDNKEEHARYDKELKELSDNQKEFQKDMGVKIDKIYEYIIQLSKKG